MRALAALLLATLPCVSVAQETGTSVAGESTVHRHLGFFFRADVGVGYLASLTGASDGPPDLSGMSVPLGLAVGGAVAENWILAGEVWGGFSRTNAEDSKQTLFVYGYALALVIYGMPANLYLSFAPGITRLRIETASATTNSDWGFGVKMAFGKEWWVGDHWGLGIAAELFLSINRDGTFATRTTVAPGLTFSATFN
jgi:hypothetical protein